MSTPSGTFTLQDLSLFFDDNPNQTQEISRIGEQNVDKEMVGLVISKSSRNKQKKLRSGVWKMFEKYKDENGNDKAKCSLCEKLFDGSSKKGTTHLRNHFRSCQNKRNGGGASGSGDKPAGNSVTDQQLNHSDINQFNSCQNKRNEGGASGSGDKPAGNSVTDQQLDHLDMVKMLIKKSNWVALKQVRNDDIIHVYNEEKEKLRKYFEKLCCRFSLTITNVEDGKYTDFGVRFIDDDWKLEEKIIGVKCIEGDQNMKVLKNVLLDLGIDNNNISSIVTNGDSYIYVPSSDERENRLSGQDSLLSNCKFCIEDFYYVCMTGYKFEDEMRSVLRVDWEFDRETFDRKTANIYFPMLCIMYKKSRVFVTSCNTFNCENKYLQFVRDAEKCWEQSNLILAVAAVLDPRFKLDTVEHWYKKIYGDECKAQLDTFMCYLDSVYNEYANDTNNSQLSTSRPKKKKSSISYRMLDIAENSYDPNSGQSNNCELHLYLNYLKFPPFKKFDILEWWRDNSRYFPTLAKMTRDFLSIRITIPYYLRWNIFYNGNIDSDIIKEAFLCTRNWLTDEEYE